MSGDIRGRWEALKNFAEGFAKTEERKVRDSTGIAKFHCFVHDQFEKDFPEDHLTRDQVVILFMRLTLDLKGLGPVEVARLKKVLEPRLNDLSFLRPNFADSIEEVDFDWHLTEKERDLDQGASFALRLEADARIITQSLIGLMNGPS